MRKRNRPALPILVGFLVAVLRADAIGVETTEYERALQGERRSIQQIHLEMESDYVCGNGTSVTRSKREIWQDGDKRRCDEIREYLDGKGVTEVPPHRFVSIETPEYFVAWNSRDDVSAYFGLKSERNYRGHKLLLPPDPRLLGLAASETFALYGQGPCWDRVIDSANRVTPVEIKMEAGSVKVTFAVASGTAVEQVYVLLGKKQLLRSLTLSDEQIRWTMKWDYPTEHVAGIAFPSDLHIKDVHGDEVRSEEKSKIHVLAINEPIERSRFSIVTAGLPPGTPVIGAAVPAGLLKGFPYHHIEWNGEALVPVENREITPSGSAKVEPK